MRWHVHLSETDKHFLVSLVYGTGIIIFWRGVWGIADEMPILNNVFVSFFVGLLILTLTGFIYREFDPLGSQVKKIHKLVHEVADEARKGKRFVIEYYDAIAKERFRVSAAAVHRIEERSVILRRAGRELHVPFNRLTRVLKGKEIVWKQ
jgi:hypothetical protein